MKPMAGPLTDWGKFFRKRPDLKPPGYDETVRQLLLQASQEKQSMELRA